MAFIRWAAFALLAIALAGCSPEYNWRQVMVGDHVGSVLFPAKPKTQARTLDFLGHPVKFGMATAEVGNVVFAVGHARWPDLLQQDKTLQQQMGKEVIASLYGNLGVDPPADLPDFGQRFIVEDTEKAGMHIQAQVWLSGAGLVEGIVMGPVGDFPAGPAGDFLDSLEKGRS